MFFNGSQKTAEVQNEQAIAAKTKPNKKVSPRKKIDYGNGVNRVLQGMEGASYAIDGYEFFKSFNGGDIFIVPDELPNEWEEMSKLCDTKNGKLVWRNNLKTCLPR